jgi:BASS family bile acid:Na+ symporter
MKFIGGQYIVVNIWKMMFDIFNMMILPIVAGFIFNLFFVGKENHRSKVIQLIAYFVIFLGAALVYVKFKQTDIEGLLIFLSKSICLFYLLPIIAAILFRYSLKGDKILMKKILSMASMVGIAVIVTVITAAGRDSLLKVGTLLLLMTLLHNLLGYVMGYSVAWMFKMPEQDRRTIAFEVGMPNAGLASGLSKSMGNIATIGLAPAIYGPLMNVTGSTLASWWRTKIPKEEKSETEDELKAK